MDNSFTPLMEWQAHEFRHYPKNMAWYITLGILAALLVFYQILRADWFGAICVGVIAAFVVFFSKQTPKVITMIISDQGVHMGDFFVPYTHIRHFWVIENDNHKVLNIETTAFINHILSIELEDQNANDIRELLQEALPEHPEPQETLAQRIAHRFKF